jgi:hypothetical protein
MNYQEEYRNINDPEGNKTVDYPANCDWKQQDTKFISTCGMTIELLPDADKNFFIDSFKYCYNCGKKIFFIPK